MDTHVRVCSLNLRQMDKQTPTFTHTRAHVCAHTHTQNHSHTRRARAAIAQYKEECTALVATKRDQQAQLEISHMELTSLKDEVMHIYTH